MSFTPEIELLSKWFAQCYRVEVNPLSGFARYERVSLPQPGSVGEQDSRLLNGLEECARIANEMLEEDRKAREKAKAKEPKKRK